MFIDGLSEKTYVEQNSKLNIAEKFLRSKILLDIGPEEGWVDDFDDLLFTDASHCLRHSSILKKIKTKKNKWKTEHEIQLKCSNSAFTW